MDNTEHSGKWWLPSNPEHAVSGTLTFSNQDGAELRLIGSLEAFDTFNTELKTYPIILGLSVDGKLITLNGCMSADTRMTIPGFVSQAYRIDLCFIGGHISDESQLRFKRLELQYSRLPDWVFTSGFSITKYDNEPHRLEVNYVLPDDIKAITTKGTFSITFTFNLKGDGIEEINLRQSVWLEIEADDEYSFYQLITRYVRPLQNFLSLAATKPNSILRLKVYSKDMFAETPDGNSQETSLEVIFSQTYYEVKPAKLLLVFDMLFNLHDIAEELQGVLESWLRVSEELDTVCNLFFGIQYIPKMYSKQKFLYVVQAIETYHRRRFANNVLPKGAHKARIREILEHTVEEHRDWLKEQLNYSNEPRLRQRVKEILDMLEDTVSTLITDKDAFAKDVVNTRNYYTHYDPHLKDKAAQGIKLYVLTEKLSYLLQACLLVELGIPKQKCAELLIRNQGYIRAINRAHDAS
ncbi:MAG TPA: HEPN domain-containing protein [Pyrinomonadaceae bacterium]|jgi:hypothetical protein|nr:HEPN domain-containing protein [Pyrinomonadaceae bacterium]